VSRRRIDFVTGAGLLLLTGLTARLYALTVQRHEELRLRAERRSRKVEVFEPRRGPIVDRAGRPLAIDRPARVVTLDLPELDPALSFVSPIAYTLRIPRSQALSLLRQARHKLGQEIARDPESEEGRVVLCRYPKEEFGRAKRISRRIPHLRAELDADGAALVCQASVLARRNRVLSRLSQLAEVSRDELQRKVEARVDEVHSFEERDERLLAWRETVTVVEGDDADFAVAARLSERAFELPGVQIEARHLRRYPFGEVAVHLLGFMGKPSPQERRRDLAANRILDAYGDPLDLLAGSTKPLPNDLRLLREQYGRAALERHYDKRLRGHPGAKVVVRDVRGNVRRVVREEAPQVGEDLELTLDVEIQRAAEAALDEALQRHGTPSAGAAAVLFDIHTGEVLSLASAPRYEVRRFKEQGYYKGVREDPRRPQLHRAVMAYPPGSTWKILSCFAMTSPDGVPGGPAPVLAEGEEPVAALPPGWTTVCQKRMHRKQRSFTCEGYHGEIGMQRAIERSCNIFFFRAADKIGLAPIQRWGQAIGMGKPIGVGIPGERGGLVPGPGYKEALYLRQGRSLQAWVERVHDIQQAPVFDLAAFGEARARLSRAAFWYRNYGRDRVVRTGDVRNSIIGQGDVLATPLQVASIAALVGGEGRFARPRILQNEPPSLSEVSLDPDVLHNVKEGMRRVVLRGTASKRSIGLRSLDVAGKTGTAERAGDHPNVAWFMGYYPASNPEVAFAVVVDRTRGHGGGVCGPVTRKLLEAYEKARGGKLR
jgi:penicillin-binding protein 2